MNKYEFIETKYKCIFCQFQWKDTYYDGYLRPKEEAEGKVCPYCKIPQKPVAGKQEWRYYFRKFVYGIVDPHRVKELEQYIEKNFTWKGTNEDWQRKEPEKVE